ncbi:MAG: hypothetical protein ACREH6_02595, partial [Geminicoccaceae bacterium]
DRTISKGKVVMRNCVFIHSNHRQYVGALVSAHSFVRNSANPGAFDVRIIHHNDFPFFERYEGREYLRDGTTRTWRNDDLQSFTPLRFMPPELMGYEGRAVLVDPDVFAAGDVAPLFTRDMQGKGLMCCQRAGHFASSVMLLDCARLKHWRVEEQFDELFQMKRDYRQWIDLKYEDPETIGVLEPVWNDFDHLTPETKLLHNTRRKTQPWKSGLPVDFVPAEKAYRYFPPLLWAMRARRRWFGDYAFLGKYKPHPDPNQERFFFELLRECVDKGMVDLDLLRDEMRQNHIRHDALDLMGLKQKLAA